MKFSTIFVALVVVSSAPIAAQQSLWTKDHAAVANLLQRYADDMQANNFDAANSELEKALAKVKRMKRQGRDVTVSNDEGFTLYQEAQDAQELTKSKVDDALRSKMDQLMNVLI